MNYWERTEWINFVQAIRDNPDENTIRLVAADWVEEEGDCPERGSLIRNAVEYSLIPDIVTLVVDEITILPPDDDLFTEFKMREPVVKPHRIRCVVVRGLLYDPPLPITEGGIVRVVSWPKTNHSSLFLAYGFVDRIHESLSSGNVEYDITILDDPKYHEDHLKKAKLGRTINESWNLLNKAKQIPPINFTSLRNLGEQPSSLYPRGFAHKLYITWDRLLLYGREVLETEPFMNVVFAEPSTRPMLYMIGVDRRISTHTFGEAREFSLDITDRVTGKVTTTTGKSCEAILQKIWGSNIQFDLSCYGSAVTGININPTEEEDNDYDSDLYEDDETLPIPENRGGETPEVPRPGTSSRRTGAGQNPPNSPMDEEVPE